MSFARRREDGHSQQIADIQREVQELARQRREGCARGVIRQIEERRAWNGPHMPPRLSNSSIFKSEQEIRQGQRLSRPSAPPDTSYIWWDDRIGEVEQQAIRRPEERAPYPKATHMPMRLVNSSIIRPSSSGAGVSNSYTNYPHAPPATPDGIVHLHFPNRSISKDDELPSYDQAVAFESTSSVDTHQHLHLDD